MSQANKALVTQFVEEFWNTGDTDALDRFMTPNTVIHMPTGEVMDISGLRSFVTVWRQAFPDWHATTEEMVAEGNRVVERWTAQGTQQGPLPNIPATGRRVTVQGAVFYTFDNQRITEFRGQFDLMGLMHQLGAGSAGVPSPA